MTSKPLHQAVLNEDLKTLRLLREDKTLKTEFDESGYNPVELAKFLNKIPCLKVLREWNPLKFKVLAKGSKDILEYNETEIESLLNFQPILELYFDDNFLFKKALKNCPILYKYTPLAIQKPDQTPADVSIRWIDDELGYGLYNENFLNAGDLIGEYIGKIRIIDKTHPSLNGYCAHYPTKWFSKNYFVIDAKDYGNALRFVNHSDAPNLQARWAYDRDLLHLLFFANRAIQPHTQLTINYGADYWQYRKQKPNY